MNCIASRKVWQGFKPRISEPFTLRDLVEVIQEGAQKLKALEGKTFKDFEELREKVKETGCKGFGDTTIYDFSLRYGWRLNPRLEPTKYVYVHSEPKKSVEHLIAKGYMNVDYDYRIPFEAFPPEIKDSGINAADVEHFLCCYKTFIEKLPNK